MSKDKYSILKQKITPKELINKRKDINDKFSIADSALVDQDCVIKKTVVIRKTFSLPESEVTYFNKIKNKALDYRVVISDSEIVRLGITLLSELSDKEFHQKILNITKLAVGRPKI